MSETVSLMHEAEKKGMDTAEMFAGISILNSIQKWLREKHNIDVIPYLVIAENHRGLIKQDIGSKDYWFYLYKEGLKVDMDFFEWTDFVSYEEALEIGLQQALKLL